MDLGLSKKVVLVTGASRGIGLAIAASFARENARVALVARSERPLQDAAAGLAEKYGSRNILAVAGDMSLEGDVQRVFDTVESKLGAVEATVASVGSGAAQSGYLIDRAEWDRVLSVNLFSASFVAAEMLKRAIPRGRGSLTFISSIAGVEAISAPVAYSAAKAGLQMAMKLYSQQAGPRGVRVNAVAPGNVLFPGGVWDKKLQERREFFENYVRSEVALQRFGRPDEIADAVVFLASERASFTTGSLWVVDGGQLRGF